MQKHQNTPIGRKSTNHRSEEQSHCIACDKHPHSYHKNRAPGSLKVSWKWKSSFRTCATKFRRTESSKLLAQVHCYMLLHKTRHRYIITDTEFAAIKCLGPTVLCLQHGAPCLLRPLWKTHGLRVQSILGCEFTESESLKMGTCTDMESHRYREDLGPVKNPPARLFPAWVTLTYDS